MLSRRQRRTATQTAPLPLPLPLPLPMQPAVPPLVHSRAFLLLVEYFQVCCCCHQRSFRTKIGLDFLVFCFKLLLLLIATSSDFNRCIIRDMNESHESRVTFLDYEDHWSALNGRLMTIITAKVRLLNATRCHKIM